MKNIISKLKKPLTGTKSVFIIRLIILLQISIMVVILIWLIDALRTNLYSDYLNIMYWETICNLLLFNIVIKSGYA